MIAAAMRTRAGIGIALGTALATLAWIGLHVWKSSRPGTDWMEIIELHVEDAEPGEDPRITYDRVFHADAPGTWAVNVFRHQSNEDVVGRFYCSGDGAATYKAGRELPPTAVRLSWLMQREQNPCVFTEGIYRAVVTVVLTPDGYPSKVIEKESNYFLVPPR